MRNIGTDAYKHNEYGRRCAFVRDVVVGDEPGTREEWVEPHNLAR